MKARKTIFIILAIVWMSVIFAMSARVAAASTQDSEFVGMAIGRIFIADFGKWDIQAQLSFAESIDHFVRKAAHGTEFGVLSLLCLGIFYDGNIKERKEAIKPFLAAFTAAAVYAVSDEIHQLFVEGRSGMITDVIIDCLGAGVCLAAACLLLKFKSKRQESKQSTAILGDMSK